MSNPSLPPDDTSRRLNDIAHAVDERIPEGFGFFVLIFPFSDTGDRRATYTSNANRKDVLAAMKEFILRNGSGEDWMHHIS